MTTIGLILIWLAVLVLGAAVIDQRKAFAKLEEIEMRSISSLTTIKKDMDKRMDGFVDIHNASVDHYDKEIEEIVQKMEKITEDIKRLDTELKYQQVKMNVVYPWFENSEYNSKSAGVPWAKDYPDQEDHTDGND